ncbi:MAG: type II 3-dehydroquinate dehydratase [Chloroflexaceae bacterium]|nr:type II 3-dehydroquinate dehydratase [Chloroflexaceae bacterium]
MKVLFINGPNLNALGKRQPEIYGTLTLSQIEQLVDFYAAQQGVNLVCFQSNQEGTLIDFIQAEGWDADGVIINPGALTHYGLALRDALASLEAPIIEVHLSNVYQREPFRHTSVIAPIATGQIAGLGWLGYRLALEWLIEEMPRLRFEKQSEVSDADTDADMDADTDADE